MIFFEIPSWVVAAKNHPLVAGFPVPEVARVESSLHAETVVVATTDHTTAEEAERG